VAVLNYNKGVNPSVTEHEFDDGDGYGEFMTRCVLQGYNFYQPSGSIPAVAPQPVDNVIASAIGDFDGDGYNELAVAYMTNNGDDGAIWIIMFRYQNDGANSSLARVNKFLIPTPKNRSMVGTLSLAAGDFDRSGVDQLLIGSAYWWGTPGGNGYKSGTLQTQPVFFLIKGGQVLGSLTGASSTGANNAETEFTVSLGNGAYVPRTVTISGGAGTWAAISRHISQRM
jgi:hypothetical protein